jgi:DNA helicase-2/ATP-dependent DNA helicase PcrA
MQSAHQKYQQKFEEVLAGLNAEQLAAVNKMDGPVLVVAGPGTGKTQILAARIGKILIDTDAKPNEYPVPYLYRCRRGGHAQTLI